MWYVLAICWFPIELAIRRVFWVFSIWINQSCCQCELRCSNDIGSCQKDVQIPTSLGREDAQGQNSSSETNPTSQAKPFFFPPMRPLSTGKLPDSNCANLMILVHTWVESAMQGPHVPLREIYISTIYTHYKYLENQNNIFDKYQRIHVWRKIPTFGLL